MLPSQQSKVDGNAPWNKEQRAHFNKQTRELKEISSITRRWRICLPNERAEIKDQRSKPGPRSLFHDTVRLSFLGSWAMQGTPNTKLSQANQWRGNGVCGQRLGFSVGQGLRQSDGDKRLEIWDFKRNNYDRWICVSIRFQKRELAKVKRDL